MTLPVVLIDDARQEFNEAVDWYEDQKAGLGVEFLSNVQEVFERIAELPRIYPMVHKNVRRGVVKRFPYIIHYQVEAERIVVFTVFHSSRIPQFGRNAWIR